MGFMRRMKTKSLVIVFVVEILIMLALVVGYAWYNINHALDMIVTDDTPKEDIEVSDAVTDTMTDDYRTIALFGVDNRGSADLTKAGTGHSDAIIIASINKKTKEVKLVSVYRDSFLEMSTGSEGNTQKCTHAYFLGGPTGAVETLNKNLDLNITDYVTVDFEALTKAIDQLGGVTIDVKSNELEMINYYINEQVKVTGIQSEGVWSAGEQKLNGTQATAWARIRYVGNQDFERTQRQRVVISAMIEEAKKSDINTIVNIINDVFPMVATNMDKKDIISLAKDTFDYSLGENTGFPLSNETANLGAEKGDVVIPANLISNVKHLHEFLYPEDEAYEPSADVKRISDLITNETGIGDEFTEDKAAEKPTQTMPD